MSGEEKQKSRDLSMFKYFNILQVEYIVAELRRKIYPSYKDKQYYERVMAEKQRIIKDISLRNVLPSIFTEMENAEVNEVKVEKYLEVYKEQGLPVFLYRDEEHKKIFEPQDIENYYHLKSEVKVSKDGKIQVGTIANINLEARLVEVEFKNEKFENFSMEEVTRIL